MHSVVLLLGSFLLWSGSVDAVGWDVTTPLDEYVFSDDGAYSYQEVASYAYDGATVYIYNMTSQIWFDDNWSSQPLWYHTIHIGIPDVIRDSTYGVLLIRGGSNPNEIPAENDKYTGMTALYARDLGLVVATLQQVPNQAIVFPDDPTAEERSEDEIIAWTWYKFIESYQDNATEPRYLALFPMVKAAKRTLDTITSVASEKMPFLNVTKFAVEGSSKRGWTTWLLSAVDPRVSISCPTVFSMLDMPNTLMHHFQSLGGWTYSFQDYWNLNLTVYITEPEFTALAQHIDPYIYRERLTMPKMMTSGTSDEFFLPDESPLWWDDLPGPLYLLMVSNAEHGLEPREIFAYKRFVSFVTAVVEDFPLPQINWTVGSHETSGWINMTTNPEPNRVQAWVADTLLENDRRDYRRRAGYPDDELQPIFWRKADYDDLGNGNYGVTVDYPEEGEYRAFYLEALWPGVNDENIVFTTEVYIIPEDLPFPECEGTDCYSTLV